MGGPALVCWLLVLTGTATGVSCLLRTGAGDALPAEDRRVARAEGVKGLGMALMAVPGSALDQRPWGAPLFAVVFGVMALWSVTLLRRGGHAAHHVHLSVGAASMVYMAVAMAAAPGAGAMAGMRGMDPGRVGIPAVTGLLLCYFAGYTLWAGIRMLPSAAPGTAPAVAGATGAAETGSAGAGTERPGARGAGSGRGAGVLAAPEVAAACRVSLGIGMFAMLLTM